MIPALRKKQDTLVAAFSGETVKLVSGRIVPYRRELAGATHVSLAGKSEAESVEAVRAVADELGLRRAAVTIVIPSQLVITKNIEIPSRDPAEIREIVNLQAGRHTPYSRDEIIVDYLDNGVFKQSYSKVLLVIAAKSAIKKYIDLMERSGFPVSRVVIGAETVAWSLTKVLRLETGDHPLAVVHVDDQASDFVMALRGKCIFVRSIPVGARQLQDEREKYRPKFVEEIRRSIEAYQSEDIERKPATLILTGAVAEDGELEAILVNEIALGVRVVSYCKHIACPHDIQQQLSLDKTVSYLPAAAGLLAGPELLADLSPEDIRVRRSLENRGRELIKTGILIMVLFVLSCLVFAVKLAAKGIYLRKVEARHAVLAGEVSDLEKDFSKIGLIRNYFGYQGYSLEVLSELAAIAPENMLFSDVRFDNEQGKVQLRGTADSMASVFSFSENLEKSKFFKEIQVKNTNKRKDGDREVTDFELATLLERTPER